MSCRENEQTVRLSLVLTVLKSHLHPSDDCGVDRVEQKSAHSDRRRLIVNLPLTFNVTFLIHHRFIASAHPNLPIFLAHPRRGLRVLVVLPIPVGGWLTTPGVLCGNRQSIPFLHEVTLDKNLPWCSPRYGFPVRVDDFGSHMREYLSYGLNSFDDWIGGCRLE